MKTIVILLSLMVSHSLWALDSVPTEFERKSWAEIEADNSLYVNWPMVMGVTIDKVCITKDKVKSLVPIRSCQEWKVSTLKECRGKTDWCFTTNEHLYDEGHPYNDTYHKCMKIEVNHKAETSRYMTTSKCVETGIKPVDDANIDYLKCTKYQTEPYTFPQVHNIRITDYRGYGGESMTWAYKTYTIPFCN